jgi:hypothetical protein
VISQKKIKQMSADLQHFRFRSLHCILKICQIVAGMIRQFHEFFNRILANFLPFGPIVWRVGLLINTTALSLHCLSFHTLSLLDFFFFFFLNPEHNVRISEIKN